MGLPLCGGLICATASRFREAAQGTDSVRSPGNNRDQTHDSDAVNACIRFRIFGVFAGYEFSSKEAETLTRMDTPHTPRNPVSRFTGHLFTVVPLGNAETGSEGGSVVLAIAEPDAEGEVAALKVAAQVGGSMCIPVSDADLASGTLAADVFVRPDRPVTLRCEQLGERVARLSDPKTRECIRAHVLAGANAFSRFAHAAQRPGDDPARAVHRSGSTIPYAGRVFDEAEVEAAVGATLDFWLTLGPEGEAFETELAGFLGVKRSLLVNSGSSANLLAFSALTSHKLPAEKRIRPGDEVITCAAGFPTTVAPIMQNGAVPVFLDNDPRTGNADLSRLEEAFAPGKTKAVMMAHALGNPFDLATVLAFCRRHDIWLIEDNCDALGSTYSLPVEMAAKLGLDHLLRAAVKHERGLPYVRDGVLTAYTGSFGDLSTQSFYPPHHLTMGEGGAVNIVRDMRLKVIVESFRDWGRDCWCASGKDNTCNKRFGWQLGELPEGYDHKYIYSHLGYNLKPLDPQAAIGRAQLRKLPSFIEARKRNWETLRRGLADLEDVFDFSLPVHADGWSDAAGFCFPGPCSSAPSWFGFLLLVKPDAPFSVRDLARHLDEKKIGNRMLFGGNLVRQPVFVQARKDFAAWGGSHPPFRVIGGGMEAGAALPGADRIMRSAVFLGTYPGLTPAMLEEEIGVVRDFVGRVAAMSNA